MIERWVMVSKLHTCLLSGEVVEDEGSGWTGPQDVFRTHQGDYYDWFETQEQALEFQVTRHESDIEFEEQLHKQDMEYLYEQLDTLRYRLKQAKENKDEQHTEETNRG